MIDQDKMRALAAKAREESVALMNSFSEDVFGTLYEAADAIDLLLAEVEAIDKSSTACCDSYAVENQRLSDEIDKLRAELEAAAADKRDASVYRWMRAQHWISLFEEETAVHCIEQEERLQDALAQRQGEGS